MVKYLIVERRLNMIPKYEVILKGGEKISVNADKYVYEKDNIFKFIIIPVAIIATGIVYF